MDFYEFIKQIDYFSFITAYVKWTLLFLVLSIILLIVCTRLGLFKRNTKTARILVKAYYVLIPIYFMWFAVYYAPLKNTQDEINRWINENKPAITDFTFNFLNTAVSDSLLSQNRSAKDIVDNYLDNYLAAADSLTKSKDMGWIEGFFMKIKRKLEYSFLIRIVESEIIEAATELIGLSGRSGKTLYRSDFKELFQEGEIVDVFTAEINKYFNSYFWFTFSLFFLGLLVPAIEIILAKRMKY